MNQFSRLVEWLAENESALSALAAIAVIGGILYGALRYVLTPIIQRRHAHKSKLVTLEHRQEKKALADNEGRHSLAVMLFDTLSTNPDDEFLSSGISSEIIAHVTMVPNIRVSSRFSSYRFKTGKDDIQDVADSLNARFVLSGSLQRAGDKIRVIAQLSDVQQNTEIWARTYKRDIEDLFDVQADIAQCILGTVLGEVKLAQTKLAIESPDHQLDAWGLVQKAYHFWLSAFSQQGVLDACDYLRQAIEIDPDYSNAKSALGMMLAQQMAVSICEDYDACAKEAKDLVETAYQKAPRDVEVLENAGVAWLHIGEGRRATLALRSAISITPLNLVARGYLALTLSVTGGIDGAKEAIELVDENFSIAPKHPSSPYWNFFKAMAAQRLGQHEIAIECLQTSLSEQPEWIHSYIVMANAYCMLGDKTAAAEALEHAAQVNPFLTMERYQSHMVNTCDSEDSQRAFLDGLRKLGFMEAN